jgi:hypothetical protein
LRVFILAVLSTPFFVNIAGPMAIADIEIPTPSVDRIDYSRPEKYIDISPAFGDIAGIRKIGQSLRSSTPRRSISSILKWMGKNLRYDPNVPDKVRNFDSIVDSKVYGGCAEHSVVFAALAKACGIPTVTVKTMDADWIRRFRTTGETDNWSGHVFLEVFFDGRWHLLNATQMELTDNYDRNARIFPGNRYAYDKGPDPFELPLSADWERWKIQTRAYFCKFDLSKLPVAQGDEVDEDSVYIAANSPTCQILANRAVEQGYQPRMTFDTQYEFYLAKAKGKILIETGVGLQICPPAAKFADYLPLNEEEIKRQIDGGKSGIVRKKLQDGTRAVLIYAPDVPRLHELIRTLEIWPAP